MERVLQKASDWLVELRPKYLLDEYCAIYQTQAVLHKSMNLAQVFPEVDSSRIPTLFF